MVTGTTPRTLIDALPDAEVTERHTRLVEAPREAVWDALHQTRFTDLALTTPMIALRGLVARRPPVPPGPVIGDDGPMPTMATDPPAYLVGGRIAQPWRPRPVKGPAVTSLAQLAEFDEPGWVVYGTDFRLDELPDGRTVLTTATRCRATDEAARRAFARYWRLIGPFSGLIRRDLLRAVARRAERATPPLA